MTTVVVARAAPLNDSRATARRADSFEPFLMEAPSLESYRRTRPAAAQAGSNTNAIYV
jgi:hypothetical protein